MLQLRLKAGLVGGLAMMSQLSLAQVVLSKPDIVLTGNGLGFPVIHDIEKTADGGYVVAGRFLTADPACVNLLKLDDNFELEACATVNASVLAVEALPNGDVMIGGQFSNVSGFPRSSLAVLSQALELRPFATATNGTVYALEASGNSVFVGGSFTTVASVARDRLAKLDLTSGQLDGSFVPDINISQLWALHLASNGNLYVGGFAGFQMSALLSLSPSSGLPQGTSQTIGCSGSGCSNPAVLHIDAGPDGNIYFSGIFDQVNGNAHRLLARMSSANVMDSAWQPVAALSARPEGLEFKFDQDGHLFLAMLGCATFQPAVFRCSLPRIALATGTADAAYNANQAETYAVEVIGQSVLRGGITFNRVGPSGIFRNGFE